MFGLFGKSGFDAEMADLDRQSKKLGADLLIAMQSFDIQNHMTLLKAMAENCAHKAQCCKKYGKLRSGSAYLNRFTPRDKDTAGGLN